MQDDVVKEQWCPHCHNLFLVQVGKSGYCECNRLYSWSQEGDKWEIMWSSTPAKRYRYMPLDWLETHTTT